jgi:8-amino-7-oxononanoate synthase
MFTASLPPAVIASARAALTRLREAPELRERLWANARHLYGGLRQAGFAVGPQVSPIVAVPMPDVAIAIAFWNQLLERGVYVNLVLPPATPDGRPLLRCSVTAMHDEGQVGVAVSRFAETAAALGLRLDAAMPSLSA